MHKILLFDIGSTNLRYALARTSGEFISKIFSEKTPLKKKDIEEKVREIAENFNVKIACVSTTGLVDEKGIVKKFDNAKGKVLKNVNFVNVLKKSGCEKVFVENDCNAAVLGEIFFGEGAGYKCVIHITFGSGIGAGIFAHGKLLKGEHGFAGEIGHLPMYENFVWEEVCSGRGIPSFVNYLLEKENKKQIPYLSAEKFFELVKRRKIFAKYLEIIHECNAKGFAALINTFNPGLITISGSVMLKNPFLLKEAKKRMKKYLYVPMPKIKITKLRDKISLYGALALVKYKC